MVSLSPDYQNPAAGEASARSPEPVAILLKGYPRLSETFIAQEIAALERAGLPMHLYSMRFPTDKARHPVHDEIRAPVTYLPEYLYQEPLRVLRGWRRARRLPGYRDARRLFLRHLARDPTPNRVRRFGQAMVLVAELPEQVRRVHAHFLHTPSSVADYTALISNRTWSFSAHAKDIWTTPEWELTEKLGRVSWGVTCTRAGHERLAELTPDERGEAVRLVYHGIDLSRFPPPPERDLRNSGGDPSEPLVIASVGRAVAKKGYDTLLSALAALSGDVHWRFEHIGGGTDAEALKTIAQSLGIADRIVWHGARPQADVIALLRRADLFALASRVTKSGDRDGLPNVLMEAQSQGLMCVASDAAAIPELIENEANGLLVPPDDSAGLARALERGLRDPALRARLGGEGRSRLEKNFEFGICIRSLLPLFGLADRSVGDGDPELASSSAST